MNTGTVVSPPLLPRGETIASHIRYGKVAGKSCVPDDVMLSALPGAAQATRKRRRCPEQYDKPG